MSIKTQLLCTFTTKAKLQDTVDEILKTYKVVFDKIFVLKNTDNPKELMCTYNIDVTDSMPTDTLPNTISLHRKKETNTLYTINALNFVIALQNDGKVDRSFPMKWENYKNTMLLTSEQGLKEVKTEIFEIVKLVHE
jgi:hypothetical protein